MGSAISRRRLLKNAAAAGGAALAAPGAAAAAGLGQSSRPAAPGRKFRGWVSRGTGAGRTTLQELTLRPISGRQIVVRTEATNLCYSNASDVLGLPGMFGGPMSQMPVIQGHGGVGVVEAVGPEVRRVQVGDRVCVSGTPQCGNCYQCLRGRADMCQFLGRAGTPAISSPIADMRDGTAVFANSHIGGLAELMVTFEEWVVPVFTKASPVELGMVCSCVSVAGLGTSTSQVLAAIAPGAIAAIVGCGPLGLSAVQGARIAGASKIIAIDPVQGAPRRGAQGRRHARARSQRRRRQAGREGPRDVEHAEQPALVRRTRLGRPARRQRRRLRCRRCRRAIA